MLYQDTLFLFYVCSSRSFSSLWYYSHKDVDFLPSPALRYLTTSHSNVVSPAAEFKYSAIRSNSLYLSFSSIHLAPFLCRFCMPSTKFASTAQAQIRSSCVPDTKAEVLDFCSYNSCLKQQSQCRSLFSSTSNNFRNLKHRSVSLARAAFRIWLLSLIL